MRYCLDHAREGYEAARTVEPDLDITASQWTPVAAAANEYVALACAPREMPRAFYEAMEHALTQAPPRMSDELDDCMAAIERGVTYGMELEDAQDLDLRTFLATVVGTWAAVRLGIDPASEITVATIGEPAIATFAGWWG